ncbi:uncharacterized protein LOC124671119 [Lolium rigidum]|uniref:uncharacterized protein LOC124671119 n=1 Tax=Lolium rigidum TaxID=89674 RepID=UPI001F5D9B65|nr:uncharacterized protein LOC124671119 [Lolium rigidum]
MAPTEWWFQFGGEVPNLQKCALRIVSQCVSSSGRERNWSAFAMVHTKQRNRLLYGKLHKCVSVRHNLKIRAEEDQDDVKQSYREKEGSATTIPVEQPTTAAQQGSATHVPDQQPAKKSQKRKTTAETLSQLQMHLLVLLSLNMPMKVPNKLPGSPSKLPAP